jgi:hypothetical protein
MVIDSMPGRMGNAASSLASPTGTIKDITLDANGLNGYIISVGEFLGMGDHYAVVRPSAISFNAKDNKWHATMNVNADQLKAAPEYKYFSKS